MCHSLGQLIKIIRQPQMETVVDKLIDFSGGQDEELRDISGLGASEAFELVRRQLTLVQRLKRLRLNCHQTAKLQPQHVPN